MYKAEAQLTLARALRSSLDIPGATWTVGYSQKNPSKYQPKPPVNVALFEL